MKYCIIIPAYNEAQAIAGVVTDARAHIPDVIVIDDGSCDASADIARNAGAAVLMNRHNLGKGLTLNKGFHYALSHGFDAVITMDADGQHLPEEIPRFLERAKHSKASIIIGNRMKDLKCMPVVRAITNIFMSWLISKMARQRIPDTQCGYRLIKKDLLSKVNLRTYKYEAESEMLIQAARLGFTIESIPIKTVYLGTPSRINPAMDTFRFIRFIIKELWTSRH
jgi:glycosyltransferase involved in cell wall biosynthesis